MWNEQDEKEYQELLDKFKKDIQYQPTQSEDALIKKLMNAYIQADSTPGAEMPFYWKLIQLHCIFWDDYEKNHKKEIEEDKISLRAAYPIMKKYGLYFQHLIDVQATQFNAAIKAFCQPDMQLSENESQLLALRNTWVNPYPRLKQDPDYLFTFSYRDMVTKIYAKKQLSNPELKREQEKENLINAYYQAKRTRVMVILYRDFEKLDFNFLLHIDHVFHSSDGFRPNISGSQILPHPLLKAKFKREFQLKPNMMTGRGACLFGKLLVEENPRFKGYTVQAKKEGNDAGFTLISPDGQKRFFAKSTKNMVPEFFCARMVAALGVKMPESFLLNLDEFGNILIFTRDMSRRYEKAGQLKTKQFRTLHDIFEKMPFVAFRGQHGNETEQKILGDFLKNGFAEKKSRVSFAKMVIAGFACGWWELGQHGGNVGLIETTVETANGSSNGIVSGNNTGNGSGTINASTNGNSKGIASGTPNETMNGNSNGIVSGNSNGTINGNSNGNPNRLKHYQKFGIVDFEFAPEDIQNSENILETILLYFRNTCSIFKQMLARLTPEDYLQAAQELLRPKARQLSQDGLLFSQPGMARKDAKSVIEECFSAFEKELSELKLTQELHNELVQKVKQQKDIVLGNLIFIAQKFAALALGSKDVQQTQPAESVEKNKSTAGEKKKAAL